MKVQNQAQLLTAFLFLTVLVGWGCGESEDTQTEVPIAHKDAAAVPDVLLEQSDPGQENLEKDDCNQNLYKLVAYCPLCTYSHAVYMAFF